MNQECVIELDSVNFQTTLETGVFKIGQETQNIPEHEDFSSHRELKRSARRRNSDIAYASFEDVKVISHETMLQPKMNFCASHEEQNDNLPSNIFPNINTREISHPTQENNNSIDAGRQDGNEIHDNQTSESLQNVYVSNGLWTAESEARNILQKIFEVYAFITVTYILSILVCHKYISFYFLLLFISGVSVFQVFRNIKSSSQLPYMTLRQKRAKYFTVFDWLILSGFILLAGFRIEFIQIPLIPFVLLGFTNTALSFFFSDPHNSILKKKTTLIYKTVFWGQILLVALKADGQIENWAFVFVALFYVLVFLMSVSVGFFILGFSYICQSCHLDGFDHNLIGLVWDFLNALFSWVWGFILLGLISELKNQDGNSVLLPGLVVGLIHSLILMIFSFKLRQAILLYLTSMVRLIINDSTEESPKADHSFETIKGKMPYLLRISPTYYMVINEDFKMKDKQHTECCKKQIKEIKRQKKHRRNPNKNIQIKITTTNKDFISEYKSATVRLESKKLGAINPVNGLGQALDNTPGFKDLKSPDLCYSDDDAEILHQVQQKAESNKNAEDNEYTCVICCINAPNAVFMSCGHGGICYSCALETWKNGDKCALCRQPIDEILKVSLVDRVNIAKVIEGTKKNVISPSFVEI